MTETTENPQKNQPVSVPARKRNWLRLSLILLGVGYLLPWLVGGVFIPKTLKHFGSYYDISFGSSQWHWPLKVTLNEMEVADPAQTHPYFLKAESVILDVPVWGVPVWMISKTLPARVTLRSPRMIAGSENAAMLIGSVSVKPLDWLTIPSGTLLDEDLPAAENLGLPVAPLALIVEKGQVNVVEDELRKDAPLFIVGNINAVMEISSMILKPAIQFHSDGHFLTEDQEIIGMHSIRIEARPLEKSVNGFIRLRHEQMEDFRNLYAHAPSPILIEGGLTDFVMDFKVTEGKNLWFTMRTMVQNLDLDAWVGKVRFSDIMHAVEDEERRYEWSFEVSGDLSDPDFDPHDEILSLVEWEMKELCAAKGLKVDTNIFFYSDMETPEPDYLVEPLGLNETTP